MAEKTTYTVADGLLTSGDQTRGGVTGFISWGRLTTLLQEHEAKAGERVTHLVMDGAGITLRFSITKE